MKPTASPILIGIIAGLVAAILMVVSPALPVISPVAAMTALFIAGLGFGRVAGLLAVAVAAAALGVLASSLEFAFIFGATLLPAAVMSQLAGLARPASEIGGPETALAWYPLSDILLAGAVLVALATLCLVLLAPLDAYFAEEIDRLSAIIAEMNPLAAPTAQDKVQMLATLKSFSPVPIAASNMVSFFGGFYFAMRILTAFKRNIRPREDVRSSLRMNRLALAVFVSGIVLIFVGGTVSLIGASLAGAVGGGFLLAGFAVIHNALREKPWALPALVLTYMFSLIPAVGQILIMSLGLANPRRAVALTPVKPNETSDTPN
jgi:hypothetical protein